MSSSQIIGRQQIMAEIRKCESRYTYFDNLLWDAAHDTSGRRMTFRELAIANVCQCTHSFLVYWRGQLEAFDRGC